MDLSNLKPAKGSVTSNIAITLSKMGFKVGILDAEANAEAVSTNLSECNNRILTI